MTAKVISTTMLLMIMGCGGPEPSDTAPATTAATESTLFVAVDIDYTDAPSSIPAGEATFELVNEGSIAHNVVIEELDDTVVVSARGGATATGAVNLVAGPYTYYCSIPGHREAGMEGNLEVVDQ